MREAQVSRISTGTACTGCNCKAHGAEWLYPCTHVRRLERSHRQCQPYARACRRRKHRIRLRSHGARSCATVAPDHRWIIGVIDARSDAGGKLPGKGLWIRDCTACNRPQVTHVPGPDWNDVRERGCFAISIASTCRVQRFDCRWGSEKTVMTEPASECPVRRRSPSIGQGNHQERRLGVSAATTSQGAILHDRSTESGNGFGNPEVQLSLSLGKQCLAQGCKWTTGRTAPGRCRPWPGLAGVPGEYGRHPMASGLSFSVPTRPCVRWRTDAAGLLD